MNIHLKIEAKKALIVNGSNLTLTAFKSENIKRVDAFNMIYNVFERHFLLPYKVQKLSKRARRNLM